MTELKERIKEFLAEEEQETLKHLPGRHNQKLHGNRGTATLSEGQSKLINRLEVGPYRDWETAEWF